MEWLWRTRRLNNVTDDGLLCLCIDTSRKQRTTSCCTMTLTSEAVGCYFLGSLKHSSKQQFVQSRSYLHSMRLLQFLYSIDHLASHAGALDISTKFNIFHLYLLKTTSSGNSEGDCGNGGKCRPMGWGLFGNSNAFANLLLARP